MAPPSTDASDPTEQARSNPPRYRCTACGNLTRFDVLETTTVRSFHHYTVGGDLTVEDTEVLAHEISEVSCRWCGNGSAVVQLDRAEDAPDAALAATDRPPGALSE